MNKNVISVLMLVTFLLFTAVLFSVAVLFVFNFLGSAEYVQISPVVDGGTPCSVDRTKLVVAVADKEDIVKYISTTYNQYSKYTNLILSFFIFLLGFGLFKQHLDKKEIEKMLKEEKERIADQLSRLSVIENLGRKIDLVESDLGKEIHEVRLEYLNKPKRGFAKVNIAVEYSREVLSDLRSEDENQITRGLLKIINKTGINKIFHCPGKSQTK